MHIVVCLKHVPNLYAERSFNSAGRVERTAADSTLNELDFYAVESALQLADQTSGAVTALTVGPDSAQAAIRKSYQLGITGGYHVSDADLAGIDALDTARVLGAAVKRIAQEQPVDLVVTGMASLDGLTSLVPVLLADQLGWAPLTLASTVHLANNELHIRRDLSEVVEELSAPLPAVLAVTDQANQPRMSNPKFMMAALSQPVTKWTLADIGLTTASVAGSAQRSQVQQAVVTPPREQQLYLKDDPDAGRKLADYLIGKNLV